MITTVKGARKRGGRGLCRRIIRFIGWQFAADGRHGCASAVDILRHCDGVAVMGVPVRVYQFRQLLQTRGRGNGVACIRR